MSKKGNGLFSLLTGVGIGVGLGMLFAPQSGEKTREELKQKMNDLVDYLKSIDYKEVKDNLIDKVEDLKLELADLDKEKVLEIAKVKAEEIKTKAEDLYKTAVKEGKPAVEKAAKEIKTKTVVVLQNMIDKLETEEKPKKKVTKKDKKD